MTPYFHEHLLDSGKKKAQIPGAHSVGFEAHLACYDGGGILVAGLASSHHPIHQILGVHFQILDEELDVGLGRPKVHY